MKRLIVNGDDFGFTIGVNTGIQRAFTEGVLTSATLMANGDAFDDAVGIAKANPRLGVGCHLAAVGGRAVANRDQPGGLADADGWLPKTLGQLALKLATGAVKSIHIEREFAAQVEKIVAAGISPTHFDTHKHTVMYPAVTKALATIARHFGISRVRSPFGAKDGVWKSVPAGLRGVYLKQYAVSVAVMPARGFFRRRIAQYGIKTPDYFYGVAITGLLNREILMDLFRELPNGITELMCHPGLYDSDLESAHTRLKQSRQIEMEALADPEVKALAGELGIELINYREI